jgi:hypothetical protein
MVRILIQRAAFAGLISLFLFAACSSGEVTRDTETVTLNGAEFVRAQITMGAGTLDISGGANPLMDADFVYSIPDWRPDVSYTVEAGEGMLVVKQPVNPSIQLGDYRYEWELRFNGQVPMELDVTLGAGDSNLQLSDLHLIALDLTTGTGTTTVDLTGDWSENVDVRIRGGVGEATVRLPAEAGVRAEVQRGPGQLTVVGLREENGAYVNEAYGTSSVTLDIDILGAVGSVALQVVE